MKTYLCIVCGFVHDEAVGRPEDGIAAGTRWSDVPACSAWPADIGASAGSRADFESLSAGRFDLCEKVKSTAPSSAGFLARDFLPQRPTIANPLAKFDGRTDRSLWTSLNADTYRCDA